MKKLVLTTFCAFACLLGPSVLADTIWTGSTDSNFGTASNWGTGNPGNNEDHAIINNGSTVNLSSDYTSTNPYQLTLAGNSTLNVSAAVTANFLNIGAGSTLNILSGSDYIMPKVSSGNNNGYSINGTLEINGGSLVLNERMFGSGTIRVNGDEASINLHQINASLDYEFNFNSTGVSGIIGAGSSGAGPYFGLSSSTLTVDGSAFNGSGVFTLFDGASATTFFDTGNVTITGLGAEGTGWVLDQDVGGTSGIVTLTVIPEPSSLALLLAGAALLLGRRRS